MRCDECRWWDPRGSAFCGEGRCRRNPPVGSGATDWPIVDPDDWCGEFQLREPQRPHDAGPVESIAEALYQLHTARLDLVRRRDERTATPDDLLVLRRVETAIVVVERCVPEV